MNDNDKYPFIPYSFSEYAEDAGATAIYSGRGTVDGLIYATLGLTGEAGEIANQVKKINRDDDGILTPDRASKIWSELGDVLWYAQAVAHEIGTDLASVAQMNVDKLRYRAAKGTIHGDRRPE